MFIDLGSLAWSYHGKERSGLRRRQNLTQAINVCKAASRPLLRAPKELNELPEVRFEFSFKLISQLNNSFLTGQSWRALKSWCTDKGPQQGFRRLLAHMDLTRSLVPSMAKAKRKGNNSLRASSPGRSGGWAGKERRACNYLSGIWIPPPIPLWLLVKWAVSQLNNSFLTGQSWRALKSWCTDKGPQQGFRRLLAHMDLTRSLVPSMAKAKRKGNNSLRASSPGHPGGWAGKGRRACNYLSGIWIPLPIPLWLPVEWTVRFPPIGAKRKRALM